MDKRFPEILAAVQQRYEAWGVKPEQTLVILANTENYEPLVKAYYSAAVALGADPVLITYKSRPPMTGLADLVVEMASQADQVLDLSLKTWAYSDSMDRFRRLLKERGGRWIDGETYGWEKDVDNIINCPPSAEVTERVMRAQKMIDGAKVIRITSDLGTDFTVARGDPKERPSFPGDIPGQVGFPPPEDSATGVVYYVGGFLTQAPTHQTRMVYEPVRMEFEKGKLVKIHRDNEVAIMLDEWFKAQNDPNAYQFAHLNLGLDHRIVLHYLDNLSVHYKYGGVLLGIGANWDPLLWGGGVKAESHIDMCLVGADYVIDGKPILKGGEFTIDSGLRAKGRG
jgi:leucyl aminopeptidase (aminopeptidase T)